MTINNQDDPVKLAYLIKLVERFLPLNRFGFVQHVQFVSDPNSKSGHREEKILPYIIYTSKYCRVKFFLDYSAAGRDFDLRIVYGRLHAPDDKWLVNWNGNDCYCWHNFELALQYLDGRSPEQAVKIQGEAPVGVQKYLTSGLVSADHQPEWLVGMHAVVWGHYGQALFDLFDLRQPERWEQYALFIKEYYRLIPSASDPGSPLRENIC